MGAENIAALLDQSSDDDGLFETSKQNKDENIYSPKTPSIAYEGDNSLIVETPDHNTRVQGRDMAIEVEYEENEPLGSDLVYSLSTTPHNPQLQQTQKPRHNPKVEILTP